MATWREGEGEWGERGSKRVRVREKRGKQPLSQWARSTWLLPGNCGVESRQNSRDLGHCP